jgi:hypothetical protein
MEYAVNRKRVEFAPPLPDENTTYKEDTTVTEEQTPPLPGPPQESGTTWPHD